MGVKAIWELCLFQVAPFVSLQVLQTGILFFGQKETGAERVAMATALRVSFCFFMVPSFKNTALTFLEMLFIQYFTIFLPFLVANKMTLSLI